MSAANTPVHVHFCGSIVCAIVLADPTFVPQRSYNTHSIAINKLTFSNRK